MRIQFLVIFLHPYLAASRKGKDFRIRVANLSDLEYYKNIIEKEYLKDDNNKLATSGNLEFFFPQTIQ